VVIVAAELLMGGQGIGYFVWNEWNNLNVASIVLAILVIGLVGLGLDRSASCSGRSAMATDAAQAATGAPVAAEFLTPIRGPGHHGHHGHHGQDRRGPVQGLLGRGRGERSAVGFPLPDRNAARQESK
jgi:hypothetical protein